MKQLLFCITLALFSFLTSCHHQPQTLTNIGQGFQSDSLNDPWDSIVNDTRFCCHMTADRFYFSYEVKDSTLVKHTEVKKELDIEFDDRVEIYFSPARNLKKPYYCLEISSTGIVLDYCANYFRKLDFSWNFSTLQRQTQITPWGYRVSGNIAVKELQDLGIDFNQFWLGVFQADYHPDGSVNWYSLVPTNDKEADFHTPGYLMPCCATPMAEHRGVVLYPNDITSLGLEEWEHRIKIAGINLIGLHAATFNDPIDTLEAFVNSQMGQEFLKLCKDKDVDVEYEVHALHYLLPRELFDTHPEYFPSDSNGVRHKDYNICFTSTEALEALRPQLEKLLKWMKPTTHRYFFWPDDAQTPCLCENCKKYSASEQNLIYENRFLKMLREYDPEATLAHLAYSNTLNPPLQIRAEKGVFLEFAPIGRDYSTSLPTESAVAYITNLLAFPDYSQHILEYWLDESMFSHWKRDKLVPLPDNFKQCKEDVSFYRSHGANSFTTFATWLNGNYIRQYGNTDSIFTKYAGAFE